MKHDDSNMSLTSTMEMSENESQTSNLPVDPLEEESGKTLDDEIEEIMDLPGCSISQPLTNLNTQGNVHSIACEHAVELNLASANLPLYRNENDDEIDEDIEDDVNDIQQPDNADDEGFVEEDEEGWITPGNLHQAQQEMGVEVLEPAASNVTVGCLTTDFAMQVMCVLYEI